VSVYESSNEWGECWGKWVDGVRGLGFGRGEATLRRGINAKSLYLQYGRRNTSNIVNN